VRVVERETHTLFAVDKVDRGSGDQGNRRWIDEDLHAQALAVNIFRIGLFPSAISYWNPVQPADRAMSRSPAIGTAVAESAEFKAPAAASVS
jgi:hypothetical protein